MRSYSQGMLSVVFVMLVAGLTTQARAQNPKRIEDHIHYLERTISVHRDGVRAVAFLPDGERFVSAGNDSTAKLCEMATGKVLYTFEGHTGAIRCVAISADGTELATGSDDRSIIIWDIATGKIVSHLTGHSGAVIAVTFQANHHLSSVGGDGMRVWDVDTEKATVRGALTQPFRAAYSADGARAAVLDVVGQTTLCDATTCKVIKTMPDSSESLFCAGISPDGNTVIYRGTWNWFRFDVKQNTATQLNENVAIDSITFTPDGTHVMTTGLSSVDYWQLNPLKREAGLQTLMGDVTHAAAISSDKHHIVGGFGGSDMPGLPRTGGSGVAVFDLDRRKVKPPTGPPDGDISWELIPAKVKKPDGSLVPLYDYFSENHSAYLSILKADPKWDLIWNSNLLFLHRTPGVLEPLMEFKPGNVSDVCSDGKYIWALSMWNGLHAYALDGKEVAGLDPKVEFPIGVYGATKILVLSPGKVILGGEGGVHEKDPPFAWVMTAEVPASGNVLDVHYLVDEVRGVVPMGWLPKMKPEITGIQPVNIFEYGSEIWIGCSTTIWGQHPVIRIDRKTLMPRLYNMKKNGQPFVRGDDPGFAPIYVYEDGTILADRFDWQLLKVGPDSVIDTPPQTILKNTRYSENFELLPIGDHIDMPGRTWVRIDPKTHSARMIGSGLQFGGEPIWPDINYGVSAHFGLCAISVLDDSFYRISDDPNRVLAHRAIKLNHP